MSFMYRCMSHADAAVDDYIFALARNGLLGFKPTLTKDQGVVINDDSYLDQRRWVWLMEYLVRRLTSRARIRLTSRQATANKGQSVEDWYKAIGGSYEGATLPLSSA